MAARVSQQEVFDAAEKIFANGINPTVAKIRKEIGRGSYSDICPSLKEWKTTNKGSEYKDIAEPIPDELKLLGVQAGHDIAKAIWVEAVNHAENKIKLDMFAVLENQIEQLQKENMHYKELEIELKAMKEFRSSINQMFELKDKKKEESDQRIQGLEKVIAGLLKEQTQNE